MGKGGKYRWERKSDEFLQFWPKMDIQQFLVPQSENSFYSNLKDTPRIHIPKALSFPILKSRGILNAGRVMHHKSFYQIRSNPDFNFITYTFGGVGQIRFDKRTIVLKRGDILGVPAGVEYTLTTNSKWDSVWFHVENSDMWKGFMGGEVSSRKTSDIDRIQAAVEGYGKELYSEARSLELLEMYADIILFYIVRDFRGRRRADPRLDAFLADFRKKPSDRVTSESIAARWGVSAYELDRLCVKSRGAKFAKLVSDIRMNAARAMLERSDTTLAEIAFSTGFSDGYSFSKAFKKFQGMSPKEFRKAATREL